MRRPCNLPTNWEVRVLNLLTVSVPIVGRPMFADHIKMVQQLQRKPTLIQEPLRLLVPEVRSVTNSGAERMMLPELILKFSLYIIVLPINLPEQFLPMVVVTTL